MSASRPARRRPRAVSSVGQGDHGRSGRPARTRPSGSRAPTVTDGGVDASTAVSRCGGGRPRAAASSVWASCTTSWTRGAASRSPARSDVHGTQPVGRLGEAAADADRQGEQEQDRHEAELGRDPHPAHEAHARPQQPIHPASSGRSRRALRSSPSGVLSARAAGSTRSAGAGDASHWGRARADRPRLLHRHPHGRPGRAGRGRRGGRGTPRTTPSSCARSRTAARASSTSWPPPCPGRLELVTVPGPLGEPAPAQVLLVPSASPADGTPPAALTAAGGRRRPTSSRRRPAGCTWCHRRCATRASRARAGWASCCWRRGRGAPGGSSSGSAGRAPTTAVRGCSPPCWRAARERLGVARAARPRRRGTAWAPRRRAGGPGGGPGGLGGRRARRGERRRRAAARVPRGERRLRGAEGRDAGAGAAPRAGARRLLGRGLRRGRRPAIPRPGAGGGRGRRARLRPAAARRAAGAGGDGGRRGGRPARGGWRPPTSW